MKTKYWTLIYFILLILPVTICAIFAVVDAPIVYIGKNRAANGFSFWIVAGTVGFTVNLVCVTWLLGSRVWVSEEERP